MMKRFSTASRLLLLFLPCAILVPLLTPSAQAQTLADTTLALYPPEAGEIAYADLHTLRQSPHYKVLHDSYLPPRLRQLESQALSLGIDFEAQAQQLSWAYVVSPSGGIELLSVAEGNFAPSTVAERAAAMKLQTATVAGHLVIGMGQNEAGQGFAATFPDAGKLVFGTRDLVEGLLNRVSSGAPGFLQNQTLSSLLSEANGRNSIWSVMDQRFAALEIRSIAPDAAGRPEVQTMLNNLRAAIARATLGNDLSSNASFLCTDANQAALLAAVAQAGFALYATSEANQNPDMAAALRAAVVQQAGDRVELKLSLTQSQVSQVLARSLTVRR